MSFDLLTYKRDLMYMHVCYINYSWLPSLCYSAGRLSSKLPGQICSYIIRIISLMCICNIQLAVANNYSAGSSQYSVGCGQDSAGCIATNLSAR